jgi:tetratricopeptide (TPR) repeat protein
MAPPIVSSTARYLLVAALALACASPEERYVEHISRAEEYIENGQAREAMIEFRSALKLKPRDAEINQRIADLLRNEMALSDAAFYYREAYRLDPTRVDAAMNEARLLLFSDPERADEIIEEGLKHAPDDPLVHVTRSERALTRNDTGESLAAILTAVELDREDATIWVQVGRVHQARIREARLINREIPDDSMFEAAIEAFEKADRFQEGGLVGARIERARVYSTWRGKMTEADEAYYYAMELAKEHGDLEERLVVGASAADFAELARHGDLRRWALSEIVSADDSQVTTWSQLADLSESEEPGTGQEVFRNLLERRPDDPRAHMLYADFLVRNGRAPEAIAHLDEAVGIEMESPQVPLMWEHLLRVQINHASMADARATYVRMFDTLPDHPLTQRSEARILLAEGRAEEAALILRSVVGRDESFESQRLMALAEYRLGNLSAAIGAIDRALAASDDFRPEAVRLKALIHHDAENWGVTLRVLRRLIGRDVRLTYNERLMRARSLYQLRQQKSGRDVLEALLAEETPPLEAAIEYAARESRRRPAKSRLYLLSAYEQNPRSYGVIEALTEIDLAAGQAEPALQRLNEVIAKRRVGPQIVLLRANVWAQVGAYDRAEADALRAFEAAPRLPGAVDLLFAIYRAQDKLDEARRSFEEAEAAGVLHVGARQLLARLYVMSGETSKAREVLEKVLEENPSMASLKNDLAYLLAEDEIDLDRALELAKDAQREMGGSANAADTVGYVYYRKRLYAAALQQFRYAIELSRNEAGGRVDPGYHYHMGLTLYAMGRSEQAARAMAQSLEIDSEFSDADDARRILEAVSPDTHVARPS